MSRRRNPSPDGLTSLLGVGLLAAAGVGLYRSGALQDFWKAMGADLAHAAPGAGAGSAHSPAAQPASGKPPVVPGAPRPASAPPATKTTTASHPDDQAAAPAPPACPRYDFRNTYLNFGLWPYNPMFNPETDYAEGVTYWGDLHVNNVGWIPIPGATIEFWDADHCEAGAFLTAQTGPDGSFSVVRPLGSDERQGYRVYAVFQGISQGGILEEALSVALGGFVTLDPASTGTLTLAPVAIATAAPEVS